MRPNASCFFVNLSQNAGIALNNFKGSLKIKWFFGDINSKYFKPRFEITIKALKAIKLLNTPKLLRLGNLLMDI